MEKAIDIFLGYWNSKTGKSFRRTRDFEDAFRAVWKKYGPDDIQIGCENYFEYLKKNTWLTHRFSPFDFLKQKNGFVKYFNQET